MLAGVAEGSAASVGGWGWAGSEAGCASVSGVEVAGSGIGTARGARVQPSRIGPAETAPATAASPGLPPALPDPLPEPTFDLLREAALRHRRTERSYFPAHKQGGTIAYEELHRTAPEIVAFYQSDYLRRLCSAVIGEPVLPTPIHDQSSCSLLFYDRPRDHIGWHYDYNFYNGRHFTVLLPLVNRHQEEDRVLPASLLDYNKFTVEPNPLQPVA